MEKLSEKVKKVFVPGIGNVYFNLQRYSTTISEEHRVIYYFDAEGKFMGGFFNGISYRRGLDNRVMKKFFDEDKFKVKVFVSDDEKRQVIGDVLSRVGKLKRYICALPDADGELLSRLDDILRWTYDELEKDAFRFSNVYKPISILPPDQYLSLVLQAAEGCSWNKCTFCSFYQDRRFRIKSPDEFKIHIQKVKEFFGRAIGLRKSIFLGDANALIIPQKRLIELLKIVHEEFPLKSLEGFREHRFNGIYSFLDIFGAERKTIDEYVELREFGVKRIYIGLETGDEHLFKFLNKPGSPEECVDVIHTIKKAGIGVGVIILAGAGGDKFYTSHLEKTIKIISSMPIGEGDIVYISPLIVDEAGEYQKIMSDIGVRTLNKFELTRQVQEFKERLKFLNARGAKVTLYDIQEFIY